MSETSLLLIARRICFLWREALRELGMCSGGDIQLDVYDMGHGQRVQRFEIAALSGELPVYSCAT